MFLYVYNCMLYVKITNVYHYFIRYKGKQLKLHTQITKVNKEFVRT